MMAKNEWLESQGNLDTSYWRTDPYNEEMRWHVGRHQANTFGSVRGQVLKADGWYWFAGDTHGKNYTRQVGPFDNSDAAIKNCEVRSGVPSSAVYCPKCGTDGYVKVARDENGMIKVRCLDCGHDGSMTNEQYYGD